MAMFGNRMVVTRGGRVVQSHVAVQIVVQQSTPDAHRRLQASDRPLLYLYVP